MSVINIVLPALGEGVTDAILSKIKFSVGSTIKKGQSIAELSTDKVNADLESTADGVISEWCFTEGSVVPVGAVIVKLTKDGKIDSSISVAPPVIQKEIVEPSTPILPEKNNLPQSVILNNTKNIEDNSNNNKIVLPPKIEQIQKPITPIVVEEKKYTPPINALNKAAYNGFLSPIVAQLISQHKISFEELQNINPTGKDNRITKNDILDYLIIREENIKAQEEAKKKQTQQEESKKPIEPKGVYEHTKLHQPIADNIKNPLPNSFYKNAYADINEKDYKEAISPEDLLREKSVEIVEMDRMRQLISKHMTESKNISAHVTSFAEADVTTMVEWREKKKSVFEKENGVKLTYTPIIVDAITKSLKKYPMINSSVMEDKIVVKKSINIGIATALPNGNLIVPVIKHADNLNITGLAKKINILVQQAKTNTLKYTDIEGGTFTLTNIGTFNSLMGTPIINQPQVAILATGAIVRKPVVKQTVYGEVVVIRSIMLLSLSYDHRIIDGMLGGVFLNDIVQNLENFTG